MGAGDEITIRRAERADVPAIVALLADDPLGADRERPGDPAYLTAFDELAADPALWLGRMSGHTA